MEHSALPLRGIAQIGVGSRKLFTHGQIITNARRKGRQGQKMNHFAVIRMSHFAVIFPDFKIVAGNNQADPRSRRKP